MDSSNEFDILYKEDPKYWKMATAIGLEDSFYIHTLDLTVEMKDLYQGTQKLNPPNFKGSLTNFAKCVFTALRSSAAWAGGGLKGQT